MKSFRLRARFLCSMIILLLGYFAPAQLVAEFDGDRQTWQTLGFKFHETDHWRFKGFAQTRLFDDSRFVGTRLISPMVDYKFHPNYDVGGAYLLEDVRAEDGDDYTRLHIYWLYVTPHWQLTDKFKISMRHLLAFRSVESGDDYYVSRHRFGMDYKLDDFGCFTGIGTETEIFYNYETNRFSENRYKPVNASFTINRKTRLQLYLMLQSKRFGDDSSWKNAYVFGQSLTYRF